MVETYKQMRKVIFWGLFVVLVLLEILWGYYYPKVYQLLNMKINGVDIELNWINIKISIAYLLFAFLLCGIEYVFQLHDKINKILFGKILKYDNRIILRRYYSALKIGFSKDLDKDKTTRLMGNIFYRYINGNSDNKINTHLPTQALTNLSFFWLAIESLVVFAVGSIVLLAIEFFWKYLIVFLVGFALIVFLIFVFYKNAKAFSIAEVDEICSDEARLKEIRKSIEEIIGTDE